MKSNLLYCYRQLLLVGLLPCLSLTVLQPLVAQRPSVQKTISGQGVIQTIHPGELVIRQADGIVQTFKIQDQDEDALSLDGGRFIFRNMKAKISVTGKLPVAMLQRGMHVRFQASMNRFGKSDQAIEELSLVATDQTLKLTPEATHEGAEFVTCQIVGRVINNRRNRLLVAVPKSNLARRERAEFQLNPVATFDIESNNLNRVLPGDTVDSFSGVTLSNGEQIIREISIRLTGKRDKATATYTDELYQKFSHLSDEPGQPRQESSDHFTLYTDISERSAKVLLTKLETMYSLIAKYYGRRPRQSIECFVIRIEPNPSRGRGQMPNRMVNRKYWLSQLPEVGVLKVEEGAGVTASVSNGRQTRSVVFACDKHGVVQHESVHAYCAQTFGTTGPVWYSEGMAEIGQYWRPGNLAVGVDPVVIDYLTHATQPKTMRDIVRAGQITGDSWKAYAWRWALCHLLSSNPNYQRRFKQLGMNIMYGNEDSFDTAFGAVADQISFEYDQFVRNFDNGYRVDLCAWDWKTRAQEPKPAKTIKTKVDAQRGWQATPLQLTAGQTYDVICQGTWQTGSDQEPCDADGGPNGQGSLIGVIMNNYQLSEPFQLGTKQQFVAATDGQLFLRCQEEWRSIADNKGTLSAYFRISPATAENSDSNDKNQR